jgi:agmatine deiminase
LNRNRNPTLSRSRIERHLQDYLGVRQIIWLGCGVFNDETDGHIDNLACFVRPGEVCLTWCDDPADPQSAISNDALGRLQAARDARDRRLTVHKIPAPPPLHMSAREAAGIQRKRGSHARVAGWRLAGSYVNFYLANGGLVMPLLDPNTDRPAARVLKRLFPDRKVVGVAAREILLGGGNIHCITQQVPQRSAASPRD